MNRFHIIIPARLEASRLPRKPLVDLAGKPLIVRVLEKAHDCEAMSVHVATDSEEIADAVEGAGGDVIMTSRDHRSGTDRLSEATQLLGLADDAIVVNLQGDEPDMPPGCVHQVAQLLQQHSTASMATLWWPIEEKRDWQDPNVVKLLADSRGRALYFSRAPVPCQRDGEWPRQQARRHIGLYAYRTDALAAWPDLPSSSLESCESLEQLRALEAGWTIVCAQAESPVPAGIDTPEDVQRYLERHSARRV
ncbi:3-deoxy-manno-octulosonate cytidylyltransferase [Wenzhouxiangella sp. AB-CW3]|uniref:3-deoxy-manno-octulosonate cytidylyltransferase n=1 Tax=Wenzhouxiangella sp. AB-CW3 TaxID=2771012 RepID=UPI00168A7672|nr:3-deoxy-manno-octulosonate cytidylyltransferase [Wenzhouxiangella sp. AB-CW3]QOC21107.1 3-deoxy-manno-octulosonate cytidylyltransferase [Wenzhouxiangella sp. AB-CW3]